MAREGINPLLRVFLIAGISALLLITAVLVLPRIYSGIKQGRIEKLVAEARAEAQAGRWEPAAALAESAFLLDQGNLEALVLVIELTLPHDRQQALPHLEKLIMHPEAGEEHLNAVAELLAENDQVEAAELLFAGGSGFSDQFQERIAQFRARVNQRMAGDEAGSGPATGSASDPSEMGEAALRALRENPDDPEQQLSTGSILLASQAIFHVQEGQELLLGLGRDSSHPQSIEALRILIRNRQVVDPSALDEVFKLMVNHPQKTFKDKLWVYYEISRRQPDRKSMLMEKVLELAEKEVPAINRSSVVRQGDNPATRRAQIVTIMKALPVEKLELVCTWLQMIAETSMLLDILDKDKVIKAERASLFALRARALQQIEQYRAAYETLELGKEVLPPVERNRWQAILAIRFDNPSLGREHWQAALLHALESENAGYLNQTLGMAGIGKEITLLEPGLEQQLGPTEQLSRDSRPLAIALRQAYANRNEKSVILLTDELFQRFPNLPLSRGSMAYLDLLGERHPRRARELSEELVRQFPQEFSYRILLAYAQVRDQKADRALRTLENLPGGTRWETATSGECVLGVAIYLAIDQEDLARKLLPLIKEHELLPSEKNLLQRERAKLTGLEAEYAQMAERLMRNKEYKALLRLMRKRVEDSPNEPVLQRELLYLQLLEPDDLTPVTAALEELAEENPDDPHFRAVLALARLNSGDVNGARSELEKITWDWTQQPPRYLMIYTAVMAAGSNQLLREEASMMRRWMAPESISTDS